MVCTPFYCHVIFVSIPHRTEPNNQRERKERRQNITYPDTLFSYICMFIPRSRLLFSDATSQSNTIVRSGWMDGWKGEQTQVQPNTCSKKHGSRHVMIQTKYKRAINILIINHFLHVYHHLIIKRERYTRPTKRTSLSIHTCARVERTKNYTTFIINSSSPL